MVYEGKVKPAHKALIEAGGTVIFVVRPKSQLNAVLYDENLPKVSIKCTECQLYLPRPPNKSDDLRLYEALLSDQISVDTTGIEELGRNGNLVKIFEKRIRFEKYGLDKHKEKFYSYVIVSELV